MYTMFVLLKPVIHSGSSVVCLYLPSSHDPRFSAKKKRIQPFQFNCHHLSRNPISKGAFLEGEVFLSSVERKTTSESPEIVARMGICFDIFTCVKLTYARLYVHIYMNVVYCKCRTCARTRNTCVRAYRRKLCILYPLKQL